MSSQEKTLELAKEIFEIAQKALTDAERFAKNGNQAAGLRLRNSYRDMWKKARVARQQNIEAAKELKG